MITPINYSDLINPTALIDDFFMDTEPHLKQNRSETSSRMKEDFHVFSPSNQAFIDDFYFRHKDLGDGKAQRLLKRIVEKRTVQSGLCLNRTGNNRSRFLQKNKTSIKLKEVSFY